MSDDDSSDEEYDGMTFGIQPTNLPEGSKSVLIDLLSHADSSTKHTTAHADENYKFRKIFYYYDWQSYVPDGDVELDALFYILSFKRFIPRPNRKLFENWINDPNTDLTILKIMAKTRTRVKHSEILQILKKNTDDITEECLMYLYVHVDKDKVEIIFPLYERFAFNGNLHGRLLHDGHYEKYLELSKLYSFNMNQHRPYDLIFIGEGDLDQQQILQVKDLLANETYNFSRKEQIRMICVCPEHELSFDELMNLKKFYKKLYEDHNDEFMIQLIYGRLRGATVIEDFSEQLIEIVKKNVYNRDSRQSIVNQNLIYENDNLIRHLYRHFPDSKIIKFWIFLNGSNEIFNEIIDEITQVELDDLVRHFLEKID